MNPISIQTLATGFAVTGVVIGLPSFVVLLLYAVNVIRNHLSPGAPAGSDFGKNPDALLLMLKGMTEAIGALGRAAGALGQILFNSLALIAVFGLMLALALWFTSRGLQVHATWARVSAFVLLLLALLPSLLLALSLHNVVRVVPLLLAVICVLGLRAVWLNQLPQTH
jgi:hypothetical protein